MAAADIAARRGLMLVALLALGRRQDDPHAATSWPGGAADHAVDLGDHARRAGRARSTASTTTSSTSDRFVEMRERRRTPRMGRGPRQSLRHAPPAGRGGARRGPRRPLRHRLAGHSAARQGDARATSSASSSCRRRMKELKARLERRAEDDRDDHRTTPRQCPGRDRALARIRIRASSTTTCSVRQAWRARSSPPSARSASASRGWRSSSPTLLSEG